MLLSPWHRERENASSGGLGTGGAAALWGAGAGRAPKGLAPGKGKRHWKAGCSVLLCPSQPLEMKQSPGKAKVDMEAKIGRAHV